MKIEANKIVITGSDPDAIGSYDRKDVEQEMKELGIVPKSIWIRWVLTHAFDVELPPAIIEALESGVVTEIGFFTEHDDLMQIRLI